MAGQLRFVRSYPRLFPPEMHRAPSRACIYARLEQRRKAMMIAAILAREASTRHYQKYSCFRTYFPRRAIPRHCATAEDHIWTNYTREFIKIALMVKCLTLKIK